jgi:hypothetical protein
MTYLLEMSQCLMARGDQLSDMQLGLLLADLQLDPWDILGLRSGKGD